MSDLFYGIYKINLEQNGRIKLPSGLRSNEEATTLVLKPGYEQNIYGFSQTAWEQQQQEILGANVRSEENRRKRRMVFSSALLVPIDDQDRITIPKDLVGIIRSEAASKIVVIGAGDHFELWSEKAWEAYDNGQ